MGLDGMPVMRTNFDIDANNPAAPHRLEKRGIQNERSAMGDAGLDHHVRLKSVNYLLDTKHVVRKLDDGAPEPGKAIDVFGVPSRANPCA
jgi:hypothetical protein